MDLFYFFFTDVGEDLRASSSVLTITLFSAMSGDDRATSIGEPEHSISVKTYAAAHCNLHKIGFFMAR